MRAITYKSTKCDEKHSKFYFYSLFLSLSSFSCFSKEKIVKWDILNIYVWPNDKVIGGYKGEITYLKSWLSTRANWMYAQSK